MGDRRGIPSIRSLGPLVRSLRPRERLRRLTPLPAWWPLPLCAALGLAAGSAHGVLAEPEYAATTYLIATPEKDSDPTIALGFAQAYGRLATSTSTLAYAQAAAGVPAKQLPSHVQAETSPDSPMIGITGTAAKARDAADIANAVADALSLNGNGASDSTGVRLVRFSSAIKPPEPLSPSLPLSAGVGVSAGGLIGGLILLVRPRNPRTHGTAPLPSPAPSPTPGLVPQEKQPT